jgi:hypothetical protein
MPRFDFYPSFNAGEVSPLIDARTSLEKYRSACRTLENFQILPYGGVIRRPGTEFLGPVKSPTASSAVRLIGFNFSTTTRYVLELGNLYMRFWSGATGAIINGGGGSPFEVATPYAAADLRELQFVQINDIMYFAHASYPAYKLSRLADNNWTFAAVDWEYPPTVEIDPAIQIKANASKGVVTLTSNTSFFTANDVGTQLALTFNKRTPFVEDAISANKYSPALAISAGGKWSFSTSGTWTATVSIYRKSLEMMDNLLNTIGAPVSRSSTVATITIPNHGFDEGDSVLLSATEIPVSRGTTAATAEYQNHGFLAGDVITTVGPAPFQGTFTITAATTNTFTFTVANNNAKKGTIVIRAPFVATAAPFTSVYTVASIVNDNNFTITVANSGSTQSLVNVSNLTQMELIRTYDADANRNIVADGEEDLATELVVQVSNYVSNTKARYILESKDFTEGGRVEVTAVTNSTTATGLVKDYLGQWSGERLARTARQSAFNARYGYARSVALHEQRLCFGGNTNYPNTIWSSTIDDFENFETGSNADNSTQFTLSASEGNRINWLCSQTKLIVGTSGDEWTIGGSDASQALSATNVEAQRQSSYGSKYMRAQIVNDVLLFIQRNGRKVREFVYEFGKDGWIAPDLTLLAEHITAGEIVELAYQQQPDAVLWCVRGDGALLAMTYERDQKVVGWHRHIIADAEVESVATIYGNGTEDEVWMVVKRTISGNPYRTVERFPLLWRKRFDDSSTADYRYLDSFETFAAGSANRSVTGLAHLNGKTVTIVQGSNVATATVSGNAVNVPQASAGYLGLPFTSTLRPMKLEAEFQDGTAQSRKKRIHQIVVRTLKSRGGAVRTNNGPFYDLSSTLTTGDQKLVLGGAFGIDADVDLRVTTPDPFSCIAILPKWDAYGNE